MFSNKKSTQFNSEYVARKFTPDYAALLKTLIAQQKHEQRKETKLELAVAFILFTVGGSIAAGIALAIAVFF